MSNHKVDYKKLIETITGLKVYPVVIPKDSKFPCIEMSISGGGRSGDSNLMEPNIKEYRLSLTICSNSIGYNTKIEKKLLEALDGKSKVHGTTNALSHEHVNTIEIYNYSKGLQEMTVDFNVKKLR